MANYAYQFDDELRVVESLEGYREVGLAKTIKAPSESLKNHIDAVRTFKDGIEILLTDLMVELGCVSAINLDGGGSTTMVIDGEVVNRPSSFSGPRANADAILLFPRHP